ncbi:MAG: SpoVA/SpoVAEb family sporulation membrane protein [Bacilli bacterium]|nr:SpoVA/SpoVAEb family sporulation membrane protein [Bacilli bacterium]MCI9434219.1 SpoVA/SpoVAEb family sporulation membrane protein [Bacilli bacterium]
MEKNKYKQLVDKHTPKENRMYNGMIAFLSGGLMGVLGQFILQLYSYYLDIPTKEAGTYMIITLIFIGCLLTCFGFFDKWVNFCKAGLFIPITGFAHAMMSAALDYKKEGLITGIGASMFKLTGAVIIFGVVSAYVFGLLRLIIFGG